LTACASWVLPTGSDTKVSQFETYGTAKAAFDRIVPGRTSVDALDDLGIYPAKTPNLRIITYVEIMQRFIPAAVVAEEDLDPAVLSCIRLHEQCEGWVWSLENVESERVGDVSLDLLGFRRETERQGWTAEMTLLIAHRVVVYKLWSGTPNVHERRVERKPLGPFQDMSGAAAGAARNAID
jgi:hypothetical protein